MGSRGPKPKPTNVLKGRGSWRGNINKNEPSPQMGAPPVPIYLRNKAKTLYKKVVKQLDHMGVMSLIDVNALARYCTSQIRWREAEEYLAKNGDVVEIFKIDKDGNSHLVSLQPSAYLKIAKDMAEQCLRLEHEFGLTPSARARLTAPGAKKPEGQPKNGKKKNLLRLGKTS